MDVRRTLAPAVLIAAVASCGAPGDPVDQSVDELVVCGRGPTLEGIDVSVYQSTVNWPMVRAAGKRFAIARVVHGSTRDTQFDRNWREMRANGLIRGAYVYFDPRVAVASQATVVIAAVGRLAPGDLPVTLDIEQPPPGLPTPTAYAAMVRDLADRIEAGTGRRPMIYTGHYYWPSYVQSTAFRAYPLWHAQYTTTQPCPNIADAWSAWSFWQYSSTGRVAGITGNVDLDRFNGTFAELQQLAGIVVAVDAGAPIDVPGTRDVPIARDVAVARDVPAADATSGLDARANADAAGADAPAFVDRPTTDAGDSIDSPDASPADASPADASPADVATTPDAVDETDLGDVPTPAAAPDGCDCRVGATPARSSPPLGSLLAALAVALRRRRRR